MDVWVLEACEHYAKGDEYHEWTIMGIFTTPELAEGFLEESGLEEKYGDWIITNYKLNEGSK